MKRLRVAMIAPPWLPVPPVGYGGIENLLSALIPALMKVGVTVDLFTIKNSSLKASHNYSIYSDGQYDSIHRPLYDSMPIAVAQALFAFNKIIEDGGYDIVHCHNGFIGPALAALAGKKVPPVLHTLHGPPFSNKKTAQSGAPDNLPMWREISKATHPLYIVGISKALMRHAPQQLKRICLEPVHNCVEPSQFPQAKRKGNYFATLARFHPDKGQALAIETCRELGLKLKMAGLVCDMTTMRQVMLELANPLSNYRQLADFRYFSDHILPGLEDNQIEYIGDLTGKRKLSFLAHARGLLFPIQWDEPFGMAPIEALACGTPVVAMARGALPEIIEHGVNGFLAKTKREFIDYTKRIDEINPEDCVASVRRKFSASRAAEQYLDRYKQILKEN